MGFQASAPGGIPKSGNRRFDFGCYIVTFPIKSEKVSRRRPLTLKDQIHLKGLKISCIIGIFEWERKIKQDVVIDLKFPNNIAGASRRDSIQDTIDYKKISKGIIAYVQKSRFKLIETLAERLAQYLLGQFGLEEVCLRVSKPGAVRGSENVSVEIIRRKNTPSENMVFFSLGSNIQPAVHLQNALKSLKDQYGLWSMSHIYETSPVGGKKSQPFFWNLVAAVKTQEKPEKIRKWIAQLEHTEGRKKTFNRFGARTLDVDLILWKGLVAQKKDYSLPHPNIATKAFVLFPLLEIAPTLVMPGTRKPLLELAWTFNDRSQKLAQLPYSPLESL